MNKIKQMFLLQQELNDATNGEGWERGVTKNGKIIDWKRCCYLECAELIDSYPWKHWKDIDATPDYENIKIEVVDIWHFIMSQMLQEYKINDLGDIDALTKAVESLPNYSRFTQDITTSKRDYYEQIAVVENLIHILFCDNSIDNLLDSFIEMAIESNLNLDTLYQLYIGKNILNRFRQDHGYKDGSYIKIWNGDEDNIVMQQVLDKSIDILPDELYSKLEEIYLTQITHQRS